MPAQPAITGFVESHCGRSRIRIWVGSLIACNVKVVRRYGSIDGQAPYIGRGKTVAKRSPCFASVYRLAHTEHGRLSWIEDGKVTRTCGSRNKCIARRIDG